VKVGAEGADDELDAVLDGRPAEVAEPEVEAVCHAGGFRCTAADGEHRGRVVDPDDELAAGCDRHRDPSRADSELHDGRLDAGRLPDVEPDVLGDRAAPRVVELGDRVVGARGGGVGRGARGVWPRALAFPARSLGARRRVHVVTRLLRFLNHPYDFHN
jgi:hypothetical protein